MRSFALTLFLIVAVILGSTHASAFSHHHDDSADLTQGTHHSDAADTHHDPAPEDSDDPEQLTHSHCAMALAGASPINAPIRQIRVPAPPLVVAAMSSLGLPPPLEPPLT